MTKVEVAKVPKVSVSLRSVFHRKDRIPKPQAIPKIVDNAQEPRYTAGFHIYLDEN